LPQKAHFNSSKKPRNLAKCNAAGRFYKKPYFKPHQAPGDTVARGTFSGLSGQLAMM
jgi:hypothetical protein